MLLRISQFRGEKKERSHAHKGGFPRWRSGSVPVTKNWVKVNNYLNI
jgi:hypothetical protein